MNLGNAFRVVIAGYFIYILITIAIIILIIRAIIKYSAKEHAAAIRKNNGELARQIAYELKQLMDNEKEPTQQEAAENEENIQAEEEPIQ